MSESVDNVLYTISNSENIEDVVVSEDEVSTEEVVESDSVDPDVEPDPIESEVEPEPLN